MRSHISAEIMSLDSRLSLLCKMEKFVCHDEEIQESDWSPRSASRTSTSATLEFPTMASRLESLSSECSWEEGNDLQRPAEYEWEETLMTSLASMEQVSLLRQIISLCSTASVTLQLATPKTTSLPVMAMVSKSFESLTGYRRLELEGKSQRMLFGSASEDFRTESCVQSVLLTSKPVTFLEVLTRRDGLRVATQRYCCCIELSSGFGETSTTSLLLNVHLDLEADDSDSFVDMERLGSGLSNMISESLAARLIVE